MKCNQFNLLIILSLMLAFGLACGSSEEGKSEKPQNASEIKAATDKPVRLDAYTIRGLSFVYYKIPPALSREKLIETAQALHDQEPEAQLILVDDDSEVADYINYVKSVSTGTAEMKLPKSWADKHIVANVQKYMSGKFVLCEGYGYEEIAELK